MQGVLLEKWHEVGGGLMVHWTFETDNKTKPDFALFLTYTRRKVLFFLSWWSKHWRTCQALNCIFFFCRKSSLEHDYLRTRANPSSKSTWVHEAVMKQQQPISFYLDPVIWRDFHQPEPLTALRALTSMQLPPRTVSFIMKGVKQSPHTA